MTYEQGDRSVQQRTRFAVGPGPLYGPLLTFRLGAIDGREGARIHRELDQVVADPLQELLDIRKEVWSGRGEVFPCNLLPFNIDDLEQGGYRWKGIDLVPAGEGGRPAELVIELYQPGLPFAPDLLSLTYALFLAVLLDECQQPRAQSLPAYNGA